MASIDHYLKSYQKQASEINYKIFLFKNLISKLLNNYVLLMIKHESQFIDIEQTRDNFIEYTNTLIEIPINFMDRNTKLNLVKLNNIYLKKLTNNQKFTTKTVYEKFLIIHQKCNEATLDSQNSI